MDKMTKENYDYLTNSLKAAQAFVDQMYYRDGRDPLMHEGKLVSGFMTHFYVGDGEIQSTGCAISSRDLRHSIEAICMAMVRQYDVEPSRLGLHLASVGYELAKEGEV